MLSNRYIMILIWVGIMAALTVIAPECVYRIELVNGKKVRRATPLFAVIVVLPLVIWAEKVDRLSVRFCPSPISQSTRFLMATSP